MHDDLMRDETCFVDQIRFRLPVATQVLIEQFRDTAGGVLEQPVAAESPLTATAEFLLGGAFQTLVFREADASVRLQVRKGGADSLRSCQVSASGIDYSGETLSAMLARSAGGENSAGLACAVTSMLPATLERLLTEHAFGEFAAARPSETLIDCSITPSHVAEFQPVPGDALVQGDVTFHDTPFISALRTPPRVEVQLPYLPRRIAKRETETLAATAPGDGHIVVAPVGANPLLDLVTRTLLSARESRAVRPGALTWVLNRQGPAALARVTGRPLAEEFHLPVAGAGPFASLAAEPLEWTWRVALSGPSAGGWLRAPGERDARFLPVYSHLSVTLQRAFRRWLHCLYFSSMDRYRDMAMAWAVIVYRASRPYVGKTRTDLARDMIDPMVLPKLVRTCHLRVRAELVRLKEPLKNLGLADLAADYAPKHTSDILHQVQRDRRRLVAVLSAESWLIDEFIKLGFTVKEAAGGFRHPTKAFSHLAATFTNEVSSRLRRLFGGVDLSAVALPLFLEATRSLADTTGVDAGFRVSLAVKGAGSEIVLVNPNFRDAADDQALDPAGREAM